MDVEFEDHDLDRLEEDARFEGNYSQAIVKRFRKAMQCIRNAADERDIYQARGFQPEKLKGKRKHQHSLVLTGNWRLIIEIRGKSKKKKIGIIEIIDYH